MATPVLGTPTSYTHTAGVKVSMDEMIYLISPTDLPMTLGVDSEGAMVVGQSPVDQTTFKWMDEEILTPRVKLAAAATTGDTTLTVTTNEAYRFATGDIVRAMKAGSSEVLYIAGLPSASTLTVTRAFGGSTATNFASGDLLMGIGAALAEGSDPENFRSRDRDVRTNYTEIFGPYKISMSRTAQKVPRYGVSDEWAHQLFHRTREAMIRVEQAILYGIANDDTGAKKRATGGLLHFSTSNVDSTSTTLTVSAIVAQQQACYNKGGVPTVLIANPNSLTDLNEVGNTSIIRTTNVDSRRGRARVELIDTEFATTTLFRNRWCHSYTAFLVTPGGITRRIFDPLQYQPLAKTGDADSAQMVAEEGFQVKGVAHMATFTNLSTYTVA